MAFRNDNRWEARPVAAVLVRGLILLGPTMCGVFAGLWVSHLVPDRSGIVAQSVRWVAVLGTSLLSVMAVERLTRRLAPLAMLLRLSILFPDRVPRRMGLALKSARPDRLAQLAETTQQNPSAQTQAELALALLAALSRHHPRTRGHSERVRALTMLVADEMEIEGEDREKLAWGAVLHDLGKIEVPVEILEKKGRPDDREWEVLAGHPEAGSRLAEPLQEWLGPWAGAIHAHHEHFDGGGYPRGIGRDEIPLAGRIVAVTDAFETMTATRSYKLAMPIEAARAEVARSAATHFDPVVVRSFLGVGVPRLWFAVGPAALVAQIPLVGLVARAGSGPVAALSSALGASAAVVPATALAAGVVFSGATLPGTERVTPRIDDPQAVAAAHVLEATGDGVHEGSAGQEEGGDTIEGHQDGSNDPHHPNRPVDPDRPAGGTPDGPSDRPPGQNPGDGDGGETPSVAPPVAPPSPPGGGGPTVNVPVVSVPPVVVPPITTPLPLPPVSLPPIHLPPISIPPIQLPNLPMLGGSHASDAP